ncbi:MAG: hypothetical protein OJF62_000095 [Pseudolabrys sp.]|nr:hypothetical protein [Pseudolabrys sp.]
MTGFIPRHARLVPGIHAFFATPHRRVTGPISGGRTVLRALRI